MQSPMSELFRKRGNESASVPRNGCIESIVDGSYSTNFHVTQRKQPRRGASAVNELFDLCRNDVSWQTLMIQQVLEVELW